MFDASSRYSRLPVLKHVENDGSEVTYVSRRFLPPSESLPLLAEVEVKDADRHDLITARTLGDPTSFWRIADANDVMDPGELVEEPGRKLRIPSPQP